MQNITHCSLLGLLLTLKHFKKNYAQKKKFATPRMQILSTMLEILQQMEISIISCTDFSVK